MHFLRETLQRKVMTVPGEYFDLDPGRKRTNRSRFSQWMRFSFGPPMAQIETDIERIEQLIRDEGSAS